MKMWYREGAETHGTQMRSLRLAIFERLPLNLLRESGASRVLDHLLMALVLLPLALLLPSAQRALEIYILVDIDSLVSMRRHVLFFLFRKPSIALQRRVKR